MIELQHAWANPPLCLQLLTLLVDVMETHSRVAHQAGVLLGGFSRHMGDAQATVPVKESEVQVLLDGYNGAAVVQRYVCG